MSVVYRAVQWNRQKRIYDGILLVAVGLYIAGFIWFTPLFDANADPKNVPIRAFGSAAFILLTIILSIGPLCRLDSRFLPLLYNRRHMGVVTCALGLYHGYLVLNWYHKYGNVDPLVSLLASNTNYDSFFSFPFETLGIGALLILIVMAATSHDFWLANLTAPMWKALHMGVYMAYAFLVGHVVLGALQSNTHPILATLVVLSALWVVSLHVITSGGERQQDQDISTDPEGWIDVGPVNQIPENRAKIVCASGERIAIFRYEGKVSAISNACQHQNGPLGEGQIIDGLVTCPWHGYQYDPASGASPPPFTEKIPTFTVFIRQGRVLLDPTPHPAGTPVEPAIVPNPSSAQSPDNQEFFVGYLPTMTKGISRFISRRVAALLLAVVMLVFVLPVLHGEYHHARSDFRDLREFDGFLMAEPAPHIVVVRPGETGKHAFSRYVLVGRGKSGPKIDVAGLNGKYVRVRGSLIYRDGGTMISVKRAEEVPAPSTTASSINSLGDETLGTYTLQGEIVDSKCYFGTMRPGNTAVHRQCTVRCIAGGIPPVFLVRDESGNIMSFLLVDSNGSTVNDRVLSMVADPVEIKGEVVRLDNLFVLKADPDQYRRL